MSTQDIFIIKPNSSEQANALKAFVQALKMKFEISEDSTNSSKQIILANIKQGLIEANQIEKGEKKGTLLKDFLHEL